MDHPRRINSLDVFLRKCRVSVGEGEPQEIGRMPIKAKSKLLS